MAEPDPRVGKKNLPNQQGTAFLTSMLKLIVLHSFNVTGISSPGQKYYSFLGVKNVRSVYKIMEIKVMKIN